VTNVNSIPDFPEEGGTHNEKKIGLGCCRNRERQFGALRSRPGNPRRSEGHAAEGDRSLQGRRPQAGSGRFQSKKAPFGDRDLYVACLGPDHTITANGGFPQYVGASADAWKDAEGKSVGKAGWDVATSKPEGGFVSYRWFNPVTHKMEPKVTFFQKAGEDVCGVGAYNPQ
jgi:hypothetical protein